MFPALYPLRYLIVAAAIAAAVGGFYWHAYSKGEEHAVQKQQEHDQKAKDAANRVRANDLNADPNKLLENDPWLRR